MGLDMYLRRRVYVGGNYDFNEVEGAIFILKHGKKLDIDLKKVVYVVETAGYWRKANQIHGWFVENVQDGVDNCAEYYVSGRELQDLYELCVDVLKNHTPEYAKYHLPCKTGFFFGANGTDADYDEYYWKELVDTIKIIDDIRAVDNLEGYYTYISSW